MAPTVERGGSGQRKAAVPSVMDVIKLMESAAAEEEACSMAPSSPRSARSPPPPAVSRTPSQHSALQPPRFNQQQQPQLWEAGDMRRRSLDCTDGGGVGSLRRASSAGASSGAALVHQPYAEKPSPESMRLAKRCNRALATLERLQRSGAHPDRKEALPPAALRTCKVRLVGAAVSSLLPLIWWACSRPCAAPPLPCCCNPFGCASSVRLC